ncbi:MAG: helix-turn-helix domain-containing protein, partial [Bradymonadaceae bacterium]
SGLEALSKQRFRPPGSDTTRRYGFSTLERWYYAYKNDGLEALKPKPRADRGHGRTLSDETRQLVLAIRRDHPSASAPLIKRTLVAEGRLDPDAISLSTMRRLFVEHDLPRRINGKSPASRRQRRRWEAQAPMSLWHGDVLHGPEVHPDEGPAFETRIHGFLDDASRLVVWLEARRRERERDMLVLFADALRRHGLPDVIYLDNGSTYSGTALETICAELGIGLIHASPSDPQARGKMERFWRTLREGCLDHLGRPLKNLHELNVRLRAFVDEHYQLAPHSGLMGKAPKEVFQSRLPDDIERVPETRLRQVFVKRYERHVRNDSTLEFEGTTYEVDQRFLASNTVEVCRSMLGGSDPDLWIEYQGKAYELHPVDPTQNASRRRDQTSDPDDSSGDETPSSVEFEPAETYLDQATGRTPKSFKLSNKGD